jgi:hypothetical protein
VEDDRDGMGNRRKRGLRKKLEEYRKKDLKGSKI